jgi:hypothetical protein
MLAIFLAFDFNNPLVDSENFVAKDFRFDEDMLPIIVGGDNGDGNFEAL